MKHLRSLLLSLCLIFGCAFIGGSVEPAAALTNCMIVPATHYTSTRCDSTGSGNFFSQRAKHTCHTAEGTFVQYGLWAPIYGVSSAGYCDGYITNRLIIQL